MGDILHVEHDFVWQRGENGTKTLHNVALERRENGNRFRYLRKIYTKNISLSKIDIRSHTFTASLQRIHDNNLEQIKRRSMYTRFALGEEN